jgi:hypothetical protein
MKIFNIEPTIGGIFGKEFIQNIAEDTINRKMTDGELEKMMEYMVVDYDDQEILNSLLDWFTNYIESLPRK